MKLNNKVFDVLKWIAIVALPCLSTFVVVISRIWGWADLGVMIAQTITACGALLGGLLGVSTISYKSKNSN